jgi:hypothetical protein
VRENDVIYAFMAAVVLEDLGAHREATTTAERQQDSTVGSEAGSTSITDQRQSKKKKSI